MGFPQHATPAAAGECCYNYPMANDGDDLQNGGMHRGVNSLIPGICSSIFNYVISGFPRGREFGKRSGILFFLLRPGNGREFNEIGSKVGKRSEIYLRSVV